MFKYVLQCKKIVAKVTQSAAHKGGDGLKSYIDFMEIFSNKADEHKSAYYCETVWIDKMPTLNIFRWR